MTYKLDARSSQVSMKKSFQKAFRLRREIRKDRKVLWDDQVKKAVEDAWKMFPWNDEES